jgi:hypothetical protein
VFVDSRDNRYFTGFQTAESKYPFRFAPPPGLRSGLIPRAYLHTRRTPCCGCLYALVFLVALLAGIGGFADVKKIKVIYVLEANEKFYGTWVNI